MDVSAASSLAGVVVMVTLLGGLGLYYVLVVRQRAIPGGQAAYLAAMGYRPSEGARGFAVGNILFIDGRDALGGVAAHAFESGGATELRATITTHDRLLIEANGHRIWFDANARPTIRSIGRIMVRETQTERSFHFVRDGRAKPKGATPKRLQNFQGALEDAHVIELLAPGRAPLRFEAVQSVLIGLHQWSQAGDVHGPDTRPSARPPAMPHVSQLPIARATAGQPSVTLR